MYRAINDFVEQFRNETELTLKLFSKIDDEFLTTNVSENTRSLGRLAWHITQTLSEMPFSTGLFEKDELASKPFPETMKEISSVYSAQSAKLIKAVKNKWNDETLMEKVDLYGEKWEKRKVLLVLINHEIHHRAQMTILMRLQGLSIPGLYGPAKEEWKDYGMEPQE